MKKHIFVFTPVSHLWFHWKWSLGSYITYILQHRSIQYMLCAFLHKPSKILLSQWKSPQKTIPSHKIKFSFWLFLINTSKSSENFTVFHISTSFQSNIPIFSLFMKMLNCSFNKIIVSVILDTTVLRNQNDNIHFM